MLIGYMRVSKADGSQTLDLQRDALLATGIAPDHLYEDHASGKRDDHRGLARARSSTRRRQQANSSSASSRRWRNSSAS